MSHIEISSDARGIAKRQLARKPQRARIANNDALWTALTAAPQTRIIEHTMNIAAINMDAFAWLRSVPDNSIHGVVTDPPCGLIEYEEKDHAKLKKGKGGVWRIPPSFDGSKRSPVPRFTVITTADRKRLSKFFATLAKLLNAKLVPGGHLLMASNPLLSSVAFSAVESAGLEKRGEVIRLVQTLRGGDRPKGFEQEFRDITVMPRSCWEPWGLFRKPLSEKTVAANLRKWGAGALRRVSDEEPFRDVISSAPTRKEERALAPHPSLKPQRFMRQAVRAILPLDVGVVYDPFMGGGSTLAAAASLGYRAIGTELDKGYFEIATSAIPRLTALNVERERNNGDTSRNT